MYMISPEAKDKVLGYVTDLSDGIKGKTIKVRR